MDTDIVGYRSCAWCDEMHPKILLDRLGGVCWDCLRRGLEPPRTVMLQVGNTARPYRVKRRKSPTASKGDRWVRKQAERAKQDAYRQLRDFFPDLYDVLYAEARQKRGVEPWYTTADSRQFSPEEYRATIDALVATWRERVA